MAQYGAFRFGWDAPARIATSTNMLAESSEVLVAEPTYAPLIPFPATGLALSNGTTTSSSDDVDNWKAYPGRLDLGFYQGDDIQIPLFFQDPSDWEIDMSTTAGWEWRSQIRKIHSVYGTLVNEFVTAAEYVPPVPADEQPQGFTKVTLFLPRTLNTVTGRYRWDVQSVGPFSGPVYPDPPVGVEPEDWPPTDMVKTWLYGYVYIVPRVTATDVLGELPAGTVGSGTVVVMTSQGWTVGPNGRVP